jgi:3'-phosphoadenosine 5'-phosphosulfate sulfotransferase (PAPS reductase)/FAD synthetase
LNPIYKEYIQFLKDKTNNSDKLKVLSEGYYWLDNQIIKAFDSNGILHKILKVNINNDLSIKLKPYKTAVPKVVESWNETFIRLNDRLDELEKDSITLLQQYGLNTDRTIIDTNSTGKDSMVKTYLAHKAGLRFDTYFNSTTMDVADSNLMAKNNKYNFTYPDKILRGFYNWSKKENIIPSRLNRCCCKYFKEEPTIKDFPPNEKLLLLFGMRNDESNNRSTYGDEWVNNKWGNRDWLGILPIRQWTDLDIWLYILREDIEINSKYKKGYDRVGCGIVCPNYTKSTWVLDQYWYPKLYERWQSRLEQDFKSNFKWIIMNCTLKEYLQVAWNGGTYRKEPTQEVIQEFAKFKGITYEVAEKYFQRTCSNYCKNKMGNIAAIKDKDVLAMNLKMFGRSINKFMCKKCLMKMFEWDKDAWNKKVLEFKQSGCDLF